MTDAVKLADRLVPHFTVGGRFHGLYEPPQFEGLVEIPPGGVWQAPVYPPASDVPRLLRVYEFDATKNDLLVAHWRNEIRAILRLSHRGHPHLPVLRDAGLLEGEQLGFLLIDDPGFVLDAGHPLMERMRGDEREALRQFAGLAEALSLLHRDGILHRNLTPAALVARRDPLADLILDGFQLSAFVASWLGRSVVNRRPVAGDDLVPRDPAARCYLSPERLHGVFGRHAVAAESFASDVFSLGMVGISLFLGLEMADPNPIFATGTFNIEEHRKQLVSLRAQLDTSQLPVGLRRLLKLFTEPFAANRVPSAIIAHEQLRAVYGSVLNAIEERLGITSSKPMRVMFLADTIDRFCEDGLCDAPASATLDHTGAADVLERDLTGGILAWSEEGASPWLGHADDKGKAARIVLHGASYSYFCQYLDEGVNRGDHRALVVKYPIRGRKCEDLRRKRRNRAIPSVEARFLIPGGRQRPFPPEQPTWHHLVESVRDTMVTRAQTPAERFCRWWLGLQEGIRLANTLPVHVRAGLTGRLVVEPREFATSETLTDSAGPTPDKSREQAFAELWRRVGSATDLVRLARAAVEALAAPDPTETPTQFELLGSQDSAEPLAIVRVHHVVDTHTVEFQVDSMVHAVPGAAWIRVEDAQRVVSRRQEQALTHAADLPHLMHQLRRPRGVPVFLARELHGTAETVVDEDSRDLVKDIVRSWPIFAVQGPPGTGKTFLAKHAITAFLRLHPHARVLVSAQSHHALDNLLEGLVGEFGPTPEGIVRIASERTRNKVSKKNAQLLPDVRLKDLREGVANAPLPEKGALRNVQKRWRKLVADFKADHDLVQRVVRSAAVVGVTSNMATERNVEADEETGAFDLVVVEEAGRGWLPEILVPLVHGNRWLIIGDHAQLPAFDSERVRAALHLDATDRLTAEVTGFAVEAQDAEHIDWFKTVMEAETKATSLRCRDTLLTQRRMHPDIAGLVSHAYYGDKLKSHGSTHAHTHTITALGLGGRSLVWLDTSSFGSDAHEVGLANPLEQDLCARVLDSIRDQLRQYDPAIPEIFVLSPYKDQLKALKRRLRHVEEDAFLTVDACQGRQAEVVLVSLVRNNTKEDPGDALGFLRSPQRANVMFSRARRLMVIIGAYSHFAHFTGTHWQLVSDYFEQNPAMRVGAGAASVGFLPRSHRSRR